VIAVDALDSRHIFLKNAVVNFDNNTAALVVAQELQFGGHQQPLPLFFNANTTVSFCPV
jgi:hypothetical protein